MKAEIASVRHEALLNIVRTASLLEKKSQAFFGGFEIDERHSAGRAGGKAPDCGIGHADLEPTVALRARLDLGLGEALDG